MYLRNSSSIEQRKEQSCPLNLCCGHIYSSFELWSIAGRVSMKFCQKRWGLRATIPWCQGSLRSWGDPSPTQHHVLLSHTIYRPHRSLAHALLVQLVSLSSAAVCSMYQSRRLVGSCHVLSSGTSMELVEMEEFTTTGRGRVWRMLLSTRIRMRRMLRNRRRTEYLERHYLASFFLLLQI